MNFRGKKRTGAQRCHAELPEKHSGSPRPSRSTSQQRPPACSRTPVTNPEMAARSCQAGGDCALCSSVPSTPRPARRRLQCPQATPHRPRSRPGAARTAQAGAAVGAGAHPPTPSSHQQGRNSVSRLLTPGRRERINVVFLPEKCRTQSLPTWSIMNESHQELASFVKQASFLSLSPGRIGVSTRNLSSN